MTRSWSRGTHAPSPLASNTRFGILAVSEVLGQLATPKRGSRWRYRGDGRVCVVAAAGAEFVPWVRVRAEGLPYPTTMDLSWFRENMEAI